MPVTTRSASQPRRSPRLAVQAAAVEFAAAAPTAAEAAAPTAPMSSEHTTRRTTTSNYSSQSPTHAATRPRIYPTRRNFSDWAVNQPGFSALFRGEQAILTRAAGVCPRDTRRTTHRVIDGICKEVDDTLDQTLHNLEQTPNLAPGEIFAATIAIQQLRDHLREGIDDISRFVVNNTLIRVHGMGNYSTESDTADDNDGNNDNNEEEEEDDDEGNEEDDTETIMIITITNARDDEDAELSEGEEENAEEEDSEDERNMQEQNDRHESSQHNTEVDDSDTGKEDSPQPSNST